MIIYFSSISAVLEWKRRRPQTLTYTTAQTVRKPTGSPPVSIAPCCCPLDLTMGVRSLLDLDPSPNWTLPCWSQLPCVVAARGLWCLGPPPVSFIAPHGLSGSAVAPPDHLLPADAARAPHDLCREPTSLQRPGQGLQTLPFAVTRQCEMGT